MHIVGPANPLTAEDPMLLASSSGLPIVTHAPESALGASPVITTQPSSSNSEPTNDVHGSPDFGGVALSPGNSMQTDLSPTGSKSMQRTTLAPTLNTESVPSQSQVQHSTPTDELISHADLGAPVHPYGTHLWNNIRQPKQRTDGTARYFVARAPGAEPTSYIEAMKNPLWR
jgi:hypothetical protein